MTGRFGGAPEGPYADPVDLPEHLSHGGSTAYHAPYRCRCWLCVEWRRSYDRARENAQRRGEWRPPDWRPAKRGRSPWYVCVDEWSFTYDWHQYRDARCVRCGADQQTEELWEEKWKEQQS